MITIGDPALKADPSIQALNKDNTLDQIANRCQVKMKTDLTPGQW